MVVLQVNYRFQNMTREQWETRYTDAVAEKFLAVDGLLWKIWLNTAGGPKVGGLYCFATRADAEAYLAGPIVARIKSTPTIANLTTQIYDITEGPSRVTHAPVPFLAQAAE